MVGEACALPSPARPAACRTAAAAWLQAACGRDMPRPSHAPILYGFQDVTHAAQLKIPAVRATAARPCHTLAIAPPPGAVSTSPPPEADSNLF